MFLSNRGSFRPETSGAYTLRRRGRRRPKSGSAIGACAVARLAGSGGPIGDYYGSANTVPVALFGEHGHHVVLGEHVVVLAHERHGLEVQVHGVHGHDLRAPHVGLGLVLGDVGAHRRVGDRDSQREHRLDAAPALGLGELLAVVVLRVEDLRDPGVVPAVHHVGVGLNESERPHGCGAAVSRDELVGLAVGHHAERRDLAVHLDAAGEPGHVSSSLRFR